MKNLYIKKNPCPTTLIEKFYGDSCPDGFESSTEEYADSWVTEQLALGWTPQTPSISAAPRVVPTSVLISRLTDTELSDLYNSTDPAAIRAVLLSTSEGEISEAHPLFEGLKIALDRLGIIAVSRWNDLLS